MRRSLLSGFAALAWTLGAGVALADSTPQPGGSPQTAPAATQAAANKGPGDPDQIICRRQEVTGSRLPGPKECHTRAEWAQMKANGYDQLQTLGAPGPTPTQTAAQAGN